MEVDRAVGGKQWEETFTLSTVQDMYYSVHCAYSWTDAQLLCTSSVF